MPRSVICNDENGRLVTVAQALARRRRLGRFIGSCVQCNGDVRAHREGHYRNVVMKKHFEHIKGNIACTLSAP